MQKTKNRSCIRFSPFALLIHGLIILPAFLLQEDFIFRSIQAASFIILSLFVKKKKHLIFSFITFTSIVVFHLFTPNGELIYEFFFMQITTGALKTGIFKAATFIGLLSLSKIMIMKDLTITNPPGPLGPIAAVIGKVFYYFETLKIVRENHHEKDIIKRIDMILMDVSAGTDTRELPDDSKQHVNLAGIVLITLSAVFHWGLFGMSLFM